MYEKNRQVLEEVSGHLDDLKNQMDVLYAEEAVGSESVGSRFSQRVSAWKRRVHGLSGAVRAISDDEQGVNRVRLVAVRRRLRELASWPDVPTFCQRFQLVYDDLIRGLKNAREA